MGLLRFPDKAQFDRSSDAILFHAEDGDKPVLCILTAEAMRDWAVRQHMDARQPLEIWIACRHRAEAIAQVKYKEGRLEPNGRVVVTTAELNI